MKKIIISLIICLGFITVARADTAPEGYSFSLMPLPVLYYTPETQLAFGVACIFSGSPVSQTVFTKQDSGTLSLVYTQNKQIRFDLFVEKYFDKGSWYLNAEPVFSYYPSVIWGVGPDAPETALENFIYTETGVTISFLRAMNASVYLGPYYRFNTYTTSGLEPGGLLASLSLPGSGAGAISSPGIRFIFDSRDRRFSARSGYVFDLKTALSLKALGATVDFYTFDAEAKGFFTLLPDNYLALNALLSLAGQGAPFRFIPRLGGMNHMRGYYEGRYMDNAYAALQAEYRFPIYWIFRGSLFCSAGQVAPGLTTFKADNIKPSWGLGLHFKPFDFMSSPIRFEFAFAGKETQFYMDLQEAF